MKNKIHAASCRFLYYACATIIITSCASSGDSPSLRAVTGWNGENAFTAMGRGPAQADEKNLFRKKQKAYEGAMKAASDSIFSELMSMARGEYDRGRSDAEKLHSFADYNHGCRYTVVKTLYDKEGNCTVFLTVEKKGLRREAEYNKSAVKNKLGRPTLLCF